MILLDEAPNEEVLKPERSSNAAKSRGICIIRKLAANYQRCRIVAILRLVGRLVDGDDCRCTCRLELAHLNSRNSEGYLRYERTQVFTRTIDLRSDDLVALWFRCRRATLSIQPWLRFLISELFENRNEAGIFIGFEFGIAWGTFPQTNVSDKHKQKTHGIQGNAGGIQAQADQIDNRKLMRPFRRLANDQNTPVQHLV